MKHFHLFAQYDGVADCYASRPIGSFETLKDAMNSSLLGSNDHADIYETLDDGRLVSVAWSASPSSMKQDMRQWVLEAQRDRA